MNEPIISPWIFYVADVIGRVNLFIVLITFATVALLVYCHLGRVDSIKEHSLYKEDDEDVKRWNRACSILGKVLIILIALNIFIPSKDTFYKMIATSYVTPANIEMIGDNVDKIADKIVDKINKVKQ